MGAPVVAVADNDDESIADAESADVRRKEGMQMEVAMTALLFSRCVDIDSADATEQRLRRRVATVNIIVALFPVLFRSTLLFLIASCSLFVNGRC